MFLNSNLKKVALVTFLTLGVFACNNDDDDVIIPEPVPNSIADIVENSADYSSLNEALEVAGLKATLDGDTEYTVFAPTNAAFNDFLSDNGYADLSAVPVELLTEVLLNHVLVGANFAADLNTGYEETASTFSPGENNLSMYISVGDNVEINGTSTVTQADIEADNGVIHEVDAVIELPDITTFALADPTFETLVAALTREDSFNFVSILQTQDTPAPFTVFAPTNDAFLDFLEEFDFMSLDDVPEAMLASTLSYHVVTDANVRSEDITDGLLVTTFEGGTFVVNTTGGVTITDENDRVSNVTATDVQATNGVIHVIDNVLFPELED